GSRPRHVEVRIEFGLVAVRAGRRHDGVLVPADRKRVGALETFRRPYSLSQDGEPLRRHLYGQLFARERTELPLRLLVFPVAEGHRVVFSILIQHEKRDTTARLHRGSLHVIIDLVFRTDSDDDAVNQILFVAHFCAPSLTVVFSLAARISEKRGSVRSDASSSSDRAMRGSKPWAT